ncbi:MAG: protein kinase, partial [Acidobacteriota bacterium]|nr:protein kinase [Acidobacteriota bacterium]
MEADREQQIDELFHHALARESAERTLFLAEACDGDEELRREVSSLLAAHEEADGFMEKPVVEAATRLIAGHHAGAVINQRIGHYKILKLLGAGGMGEVYLAEDTMLGRRVAVKLLPAHFTTDNERVRRFQREARSVSALNHPNILTIHEIGRSDSTHFIATEFIDGVTLRERMNEARLSL